MATGNLAEPFVIRQIVRRSARADWVELLVPCTRDAADRIQSFVQQLETDLPADTRDSLGLAFRELLLNGIEWGGRRLIRAIADELIYSERQNEVVFVKYLDAP